MKEFTSHLCGQITNYKTRLQKQQQVTHASHSSSFKGIRLKKKLRKKEEKGVKKGEGLKRNSCRKGMCALVIAVLLSLNQKPSS